MKVFRGFLGVLLILIVLLPLCLITLPAHASWWNASWSYRLTMSFNAATITTNLTDFPVAVLLSSSVVDFSKIKAGGADIRFVDSNDTTQLPYEIETWSDISETAVVWVKIPQINSGSDNDYFYMYYGNSSATDAQSVSAVWSNGYIAVWHMGNYTDSTGNGHTLNEYPGAGVPTVVTGKVGNAMQFVAASHDYLRVFNDASLTPIDLSLECWWSPASDQFAYLVSKSYNATLQTYALYAPSAAHVINSVMTVGDGTINVFDTDDVRNYYATLGQWNYLGGTFKDSTNTTQIYSAVGSPVGTIPGYPNEGTHTDATISLGENGNDLFIGARRNGYPAAEFDGRLDEIRISSVSRSESWIRASYMEQNNTFIRYGVYTGWWDTDWNYRTAVTIDNSASTQSFYDYPVLMSINGTNISYADIRTNGEDVRVVDSDDFSVLPYEIETWNTSGNSYIWASIPYLPAGGSTTVYIYYNNATCADGQNKTQVWSWIYTGVFHMNDVTTSTLSDSTTYNTVTTKVGANEPLQSTGLAGKAQTFDGVNDFVTVGDSLDTQLYPGTDITFSVNVVAKGPLSGLESAFAAKGRTPAGYYLQTQATNKLNFTLYTDNFTEDLYSSSTANAYLTDANYHVITASISRWANTVDIYVDGVEVAYTADSTVDGGFDKTNDVVTSQSLGFGANDNIACGSARNLLTNYFAGGVDEVEVLKGEHFVSGEEAEAFYLNVNGSWTSYGARTPQSETYLAPAVSTSAVTGISMTRDGVTAATFNGNLLDMGGAPSCNVYFEYGTTIAYGSSTTPVVQLAIGVFTASAPATLIPGTTYHCRAVATNATTSGVGADQSFTFTMPSVTTQVSTGTINSGGTSATLRGTVSTTGVASSEYVYFQWGYDASYGNSTTQVVKSGTGNYTTTISHYSPYNTIHFRSVARVGSALVYGTDSSFQNVADTTPNITLAILIAFGAVGILIVLASSMLLLTHAAPVNIVIGAVIVGVLTVIGTIVISGIVLNMF